MTREIQVPVVKRVVERDTRFVEIDTQDHQHAFDYACGEYVRRYPGSIGVIEGLKSLVSQYLSSKGKKG